MKILRLTHTFFRVVLSIAMMYAGFAHITFLRSDFQAQVPDWLWFNPDSVVIISGFIEIILGFLLLFYKRRRREIGVILAVFFVLIFPGNIHQYVNGIDAFGLNTDHSRFVRLFFQPVLVFLALWCSGFWNKRESK